MNKVVLGLISLLFCNTLFANTPEDKPLSHYLAMASANSFNRLENVEKYTEWVALKLPPQQVKDVKNYFKKYGLKPSDKVPHAVANGNKLCLDKTECFVFTDTTVSYNGIAFKVEDKPFGKVLSDICAKVGCGKPTAQLDFIPRAYASSRSPWIGALLGSLVGWFAADQLGANRGRGAIAGAIIGGLATHAVQTDMRSTCNSNCTTTCSNGQYAIQPVGAAPQYVPPAYYYTAYGQNPGTCTTGSTGLSDLQIALNTPQQPTYCTAQCIAPQPYNPAVAPGTPAGPQYQPAVVSEKQKKESGRKAASEEKK